MKTTNTPLLSFRHYHIEYLGMKDECPDYHAPGPEYKTYIGSHDTPQQAYEEARQWALECGYVDDRCLLPGSVGDTPQDSVPAWREQNGIGENSMRWGEVTCYVALHLS